MAAPPPFMMGGNAWNMGGVGVSASPQAKRNYAEQLSALAEEKVRKGTPREQAIIEARRELNTQTSQT